MSKIEPNDHAVLKIEVAVLQINENIQTATCEWVDPITMEKKQGTFMLENLKKKAGSGLNINLDEWG